MSINDFVLNAVIGRGSSSVVLSATHTTTLNRYAIKMIRKGALSENGKVRISNERNIMRQLDHPYVNPLHFALQDPIHLYLVTDYTSRGDLFDCKTATNLGVSAIWFYLIEILCALKYIHSRGVIFGDMKPENVLITEDGHIKLTDFGFSRLTREVDGVGVAGTTLYFAPEMIHHELICQANDVWALGIIAYELYTGTVPWQGRSAREMCEQIIHADLSFRMSARPPMTKLRRFVEMCTDQSHISRFTCAAIYEAVVTPSEQAHLEDRTLVPPYIPKEVRATHDHYPDFDLTNNDWTV